MKYFARSTHTLDDVDPFCTIAGSPQMPIVNVPFSRPGIAEVLRHYTRTAMEIGKYSYPNTYYPIGNRVMWYLRGHASDREPEFIFYQNLRKRWEPRPNPGYRP